MLLPERKENKMSTIKSFTAIDHAGEEITIRSALPKDSAQLVKLNKEIIAEGPFMLHEPDEYKMTIAKQREQIKKFTNGPGHLFLIAEAGKKIIGYLTFNNWGLKRTKHNGYLGLFLKKKFRDKGIGRMLMKELINWGQLNPQIEKLSLAVFSTNPRAITLYKNLGFSIEGRCTADMKINGEYVDSILMYKFVKDIKFKSAKTPEFNIRKNMML